MFRLVCHHQYSPLKTEAVNWSFDIMLLSITGSLTYRKPRAVTLCPLHISVGSENGGVHFMSICTNALHSPGCLIQYRKKGTIGFVLSYYTVAIHVHTPSRGIKTPHFVSLFHSEIHCAEICAIFGIHKLTAIFLNCCTLEEMRWMREEMSFMI